MKGIDLGDVPPPCLLLDAHNAIRAEQKLRSLEWDDRLAAAAQAHADHMAAVRTLSHEEVGDGGPWRRIQESGYRSCEAAENIAAGQATEGEVMASWMGDAWHREAVLGPFRDMGAGVATAADGALYWCVDYANPAMKDEEGR